MLQEAKREASETELLGPDCGGERCYGLPPGFRGAIRHSNSGRHPYRKGSLTARFMGVTTLLLDDGQTAIMTDGFFFRGLGLCRLSSAGSGADTARIADAFCGRIGRTPIAAVVMVAHSHYDHALDPARVAELSRCACCWVRKSTLNIGRGLGLPTSQMHARRGRRNLCPSVASKFGRCGCPRSPPGGHCNGDIGNLVYPPVRACALQGGRQLLLCSVEHAGRCACSFIPAPTSLPIS